MDSLVRFRDISHITQGLPASWSETPSDIVTTLTVLLANQGYCLVVMILDVYGTLCEVYIRARGSLKIVIESLPAGFRCKDEGRVGEMNKDEARVFKWWGKRR